MWYLFFFAANFSERALEGKSRNSKRVLSSIRTDASAVAKMGQHQNAAAWMCVLKYPLVLTTSFLSTSHIPQLTQPTEQMTQPTEMVAPPMEQMTQPTELVALPTEQTMPVAPTDPALKTDGSAKISLCHLHPHRTGKTLIDHSLPQFLKNFMKL